MRWFAEQDADRLMADGIAAARSVIVNAIDESKHKVEIRPRARVGAWSTLKYGQRG